MNEGTWVKVGDSFGVMLTEPTRVGDMVAARSKAGRLTEGRVVRIVAMVVEIEREQRESRPSPNASMDVSDIPF
jgi:hypothetical protein